MRLMSPGFWAAVMAAGLFAGCGSPQAPAAEHSGTAYELVLLEKPDTLEGYVKVEQAFYGLCVAAAQAMHAATKPFPKLPASLGSTRTTYLIRGRDRVVRHEYLGELDVSKMTADHQCEADIAPDTRLNVDMVVGATHTSIGTDDDGRPLVHTEDITALRRMDASSPAESIADYTESRTLNGIELRCLPKGKPPLDPDQVQDMCVYARGGILVEPDGKAIVLASRLRPVPNSKYIMILEPESLRTIEHPDSSQFNAATYTR
jgi:hypothetical protein